MYILLEQLSGGLGVGGGVGDAIVSPVKDPVLTPLAVLISCKFKKRETVNKRINLLIKMHNVSFLQLHIQ